MTQQDNDSPPHMSRPLLRRRRSLPHTVFLTVTMIPLPQPEATKKRGRWGSNLRQKIQSCPHFWILTTPPHGSSLDNVRDVLSDNISDISPTTPFPKFLPCNFSPKTNRRKHNQIWICYSGQWLTESQWWTSIKSFDKTANLEVMHV